MMSAAIPTYKSSTDERKATAGSTFTSGQSTGIWLVPDETTLYLPSTSYVYMLGGRLPGNRWFKHPMVVVVAHDDGEVIVSEPEFHMHAAAATETEAIEAFRRIVAGYLDLLGSRERTLGAHLRDQLEYLRSMIRPA